MSQYTQLNMIIWVEIFFALFNTIVCQRLVFDKPHGTVDVSDFFSHVHTMMTPKELYHTFGTEDGPVPEYKVFSMNLRPSRMKRHIDDEIQLKVEIDDRIIDLNLIATDRHLVTKNIPVWLAHTDPSAYKNIRYDPYLEAMKDIEFRMYHDLENQAAITVYTDPEGNSIMDGIVTSRYAIKSLPKRLSLDLITKASQYLVETSILRNKSIEPEEEEITGHFLLIKIQQDVVDSPMITPMFQSREKRQSTIWRKKTISETVYPEILLVLDHDIIRDRSLTEALQFVLAFWNGVDMVYSAINKPKINLNIAGIIISADDNATPYIAQDTSFNATAGAWRIPKKMGLYFNEETNRFPDNFYDIVFAMTTMRLCDDKIEACAESPGYAKLGYACKWRYNVRTLGALSSAGLINYNKMYGGVNSAVQQIAYLFGVPHEQIVGISSECNEDIMEQTAEVSWNNFTWSKCSKASLRRFFSTEKKPRANVKITKGAITKYPW